MKTWKNKARVIPSHKELKSSISQYSSSSHVINKCYCYSIKIKEQNYLMCPALNNKNIQGVAICRGKSMCFLNVQSNIRK